MTKILNVLTTLEERRDFNLNDGNNQIIDGSKLVVFPGLIDPHVHFRVPGMEYKEDWITGSRAAFNGGYTTVFDMPNTKPATTTYERLQEKTILINKQIVQSELPLNYRLFFGADKNNFQEIVRVKDQIAGIKIFMGASTGDLLMDDESSMHAVYAIAKAFNLPIALHAEDEQIIRSNTEKYKNETDFKYHSIIRSEVAAVTAVQLVIKLAKIYNVKSYILHLSTKAEIDLIRAAKNENIPVYAETCAHYLFLDNSMYNKLSGLAKMNPPLRSHEDQNYLWEAINDGTIDIIASDHAPHTLSEKEQPLCKCPSGIPGIETTVPLMLTAYKQGRVSLERLESLLYTNAKDLFNLPSSHNLVFANIEDYYLLTNDRLYTKVKWSPFSGMNLTGYPEYIFANNKLFLFKK
ncbi:MAG: dihydroorotase [Burkholderiales bacterium]|jgi:dihydroorotase|nr:dihydroorotase [Burkholderiales bacterium]